MSVFPYTILGWIDSHFNLDLGARRALTSFLTVQLCKSDFDGVAWDTRAMGSFGRRRGHYILLDTFYIHKRNGVRRHK